MKKGILTMVLAFVAVLAFGQKVELTTSELAWEGKKPAGSHEGTVSISEYELEKDGKSLSGMFTIDLNTIECTDLSGLMKGKLVGHLKSPDFFDTATYPMAKLELTETVKAGDGYLLIGKLTIKDVTKDVALPATIEFGDESFTASSMFSIDRTDYNVEYASESMVAKLKDKIIYNDINFKIMLQGTY